MKSFALVVLAVVALLSLLVEANSKQYDPTTRLTEAAMRRGAMTHPKRNLTDGASLSSLDALKAVRRAQDQAHQPVLEALNKNKLGAGNDYHPLMAYREDPKQPPKSLYEAQWEVISFHDNGGYDSEMSLVIDNALLYAQNMPVGAKSVWVFDVDETTLSGYEQMLSIGFGYVPKLNHEWVLQASAPAIPQSLNLYKLLVERGFKIIFLTGRHEDEHDATITNLHRQGYTTFETLITRKPEEYKLTATEYKTAHRKRLVEVEGYDIVGCVGDQWSDLRGGFSGFKVKLPNYIYYLP